MRELRLYSRAFNRDEKIHYLFDSDTRYLSEIGSYLLFTIPFNSYQINNGRIFVSPKYVNVAGVETETTLEELSKVCYVADVEYGDDSNITRAVYYFVRRCYDESGNMFLDVERDLWASSLLKASFGAFHITRSNRKVSNYVLPDVPATYDYLPPQELGPKINIADASVLFVMSYGLTGGLFSAEVSKNCVLAVKLSDIYNIIHTAAPEFDNKSIVDKAIDLIGGINNISWTKSAFQSSAAVIKAWIVPNEALPVTAYPLPDVSAIHTRGQLTKGYDTLITTAKAVPPHIHTKVIDVEGEYLARSGEKLELGTYAEIGTIGNSMPFKRGEDFKFAFYKFVFDSKGLSVSVEQGTRNKDITEGFEMTLTMNGLGETSQQKQAGFMQTMATSLIGVGANLLIGNVGGAIATGIGAGASLLSDATGQSVNRASTMGDGAVTFDYNDVQINCPYVVRPFYRSTDYDGMLMYSGAPCDLFTDYGTIKTIPAFEYLDETLRPIPEAVIACDYIEVNGLNMDEEKYIKDEFARGIKIAYII